MSMSEYENQNHREWDTFFPSTIEPAIPDDFSADDLAFAQELDTLFSPEEEIVPPYYAQTLLQAEDPRYAPVDAVFAQKTNARVFRALRLRRRLFAYRRSPFTVIAETLRDIFARKSLMAWAAALMLMMMVTAAFTAPSFEQGVSMLLRGSPSGVLETKRYPNNVHNKHPHCCNNTNSLDIRPEQEPLLQARQQLHFNIYWPQAMPANYTLDNITIYVDPENTWADGPIIDLTYDLDTSSVNQKGTGQIVIREFKPLEQVLQVVQDGNAYPIDADQNGNNPKAIYVDGQWLSTGKLPQQFWGRGVRSEVIYQQSGVVFWIAGNQLDGINEKSLWKVAQSLQTVPFTHPALFKGEMVTVLLPSSSVLIDSPFSNDLVYTPSADGANGQYYVTMSTYSGKTNGAMAKSLPRTH